MDASGRSVNLHWTYENSRSYQTDFKNSRKIIQIYSILSFSYVSPTKIRILNLNPIYLMLSLKNSKVFEPF